MKAYEQLAIISNGQFTTEEAKKAFTKWRKEVGYSKEQAEKELFDLPSYIGVAILQTHMS